MKVLDVKSFQSGIDQTVKDLEGLRAQVEPIQRAIRDFHSLEEDLKGQGGLAIRAFYKDTHEPFLIFLHQSLTDYENLLKEMKEAIESYESHDSGYISQAYIENEVIEGFDKVETKVIELTSDANSIIEKVDDLVSISEINESQVIEDVQAGKRKADEVVEKLNILDEFQASQLEETQDDIQTMRTLLTEMESKFANGSLSIANYSPDSLKDIDAYNKIKEDIYNRDKKTISTVDIDNIEEMSMSEIEMLINKLSSTLDKNSQEFLNEVYTDLENGEIDRATFQLIVKEMNGSNLSEMDDDSRAYIEAIYRDLKDDEVNNEVFTTVFSGVVSTGAIFIKDMLKGKIKGEVIDAAVEGAAKWIKNTTELFVNPEAVLSTVGGHEVTRTVTNTFKDQVRNFVNFGAKHGPIFIGTAFDAVSQVAIGDEDPEHAVMKSIGHIGTAAVGRLAGVAITAGAATLFAPVTAAAIGVVAGLAIGTVGAKLFDKAYDKWGRDIVDNVVDVGKNIKNSIGNAVTGFFGKLAFN